MAVRLATVDELEGLAQAMRKYVVPIPAPANVIDTCGTGGVGSRIFNVSTAAAIVAAACGAPVAKHGNRSVTSTSGSADVLRVLGVNIEAAPEVQARSLKEAGICFAFAPKHHPAMRYVAEVRKELGFSTTFNLVGPLTNPAGAKRQLIGVGDKVLVPRMLQVLCRLGAKRAMVVCGTDPSGTTLCELSIAGETYVSLFTGSEVREFTLGPDDVGLNASPLSGLQVDSAEESAEIICGILAGQKGGARDIVLLNAGAALWVAETVGNIREGIVRAAAAIDAGQAARTLAKLAEISQSAG